MSEKAKTSRTPKQKFLRGAGAVAAVAAFGGTYALGYNNAPDEHANSVPVAASTSKVPHPDLGTSGNTSTPRPTSTTAETRQLPQPESISPKQVDGSIGMMGQNVKNMYDGAPAGQKSWVVGPDGATTYTMLLNGRDGTKYTLTDTQAPTYDGPSAGVQGVSVRAEGDQPYSFTFSQTEGGGWDLTCKDTTHNVHVTDQSITLTSGEVINDPGRAEVTMYRGAQVAMTTIGELYGGSGGNTNATPVAALCAPLEGN